MGLFQLHVAFEKKGKCMQSTFKIVLFESPCALSLTSLLSSCSPSCNQLKKEEIKEFTLPSGPTSWQTEFEFWQVQHQKKKYTTTTIYTLKCLFGWMFGTLAERVCQKNCISHLRGQGCTSCNSCLAAGSWRSLKKAIRKVVTRFSFLLACHLTTAGRCRVNSSPSACACWNISAQGDEV